VQVSEPGTAAFANLRVNIQNIGPTLFNLAGRALQVCDWYRNHQFCGRCGKAATDSERDRSTVCAGCKLNFYPRLSPSIIVLVHRGDEVLLGRNHMFPEGLFSTLAGFVEPGESIEETVIREVKEEVGVNVSNLSYRGSQPWPFPNSLMLGFHAEYQSGDIVLQEDEIAEAGWFPCTDLPLIPGKFAISRWLIDEYLSQHDISV
jgi:NAD+ diphosphatase